MRPKSLILLVLALGCGLIAAVGINQILATPSADVQTVGIVVAKAEIKKGDLIKPDEIRLQEWHVDALPEGAIQKIDDLAERRVKTLIVPGEAILESKLVPKGSKENEIPTGMKGVSVQVDSVSGMAGLILPGDNVDVLVHVTANAAAGIPATTTKLLLKNIKVHAVDDVTERPAPGEPAHTARTVTLLVTPKQAALVTHATEIGRIRLIARSSKEGEEESIDDSVSNADILGGAADDASLPSLPTLSPLPTVTPPPSNDLGKGIVDLLKEMSKARDLGATDPVEQPWKMILIEGIDSKEMEFTKDSKLGQLTTAGGGSSPASGAAEPDSPFTKLPPIEQEEPTDSGSP